MSVADTAELLVLLKLKDQISGPLKTIDRNVQHLAKSTDATSTKIGKGIGIGLRNVATLAAGAAVAVGSVAAVSAKWAGNFEAQLHTINTVARETPTGLAAIGDAVRKIAKDTGTTLDDLTQGYYDLVSAGIKAKDATNVLTQANTLAIGGLSTTAQAVDLLTTAINTYGGDATKAGKYTDIFAKAIERGKVTAAGLAESFALVGPIAAASRIGIDELAAGYARLTASGVPAAEAATQMRSAIVALTRRTKDLKDLEKQTGKSYLSIAGNKGLVVALNEMRKDAAKAGIPLINLLGRVEGLNFTLATTGPNFANYNADLKAMGSATGTAAAQMAERQQGLNFQLAKLRANVHDAGITIGAALLPPLTRLTGQLNDLIQGHEGDIKRFGETLGRVFDRAFSPTNIAAATKFAEDTLPTIASGLKLTASVAKGALDAFNSLPPEVKSIAIAALVGNKLTGGLIASGIGDIAKNVLSGGGLLGRGATAANPVYVFDTNPLKGGGGTDLLPKLSGAGGLTAASGVAGIGALAGPIAILAGIAFAGAAARSNLVGPNAPLNLRGNAYGVSQAGLPGNVPTNYFSKGPAGQSGGTNPLLFKPEAGASEGMRQFSTELSRTGDNLEGMRQAVIASTRNLRSEYLTRKALYEREKKAIGDRNRISVVSHGGKDAVLIADTLAAKFAHSQAPFYKSARNQERALDGLKALQARFIAQGDTKTAARIGRDISTLRGAIKGQKPPNVSVKVSVTSKVSVRDAELARTTSFAYGHTSVNAKP